MAGVNQYKLDWKVIDKFLVAGCSGVEIAAYIGVGQETIYDRCLKEKGVKFHEYVQEKRSKGDSLLKDKQFQIAMSGNTTMLIWLGKQRLDQKEKSDKEPLVCTPEQMLLMTALLDQIKKSQDSALNKANNRSKSE
jgi:hypothetical protein